MFTDTLIFVYAKQLSDAVKFWAMLAPISVSRLQMVLREKKNLVLLSTCFIASFEGGLVKSLNLTKWVDKGLVRPSDLEETRLGMDECTLYWLDWSKNPMRGDFNKDYPRQGIIG